MKLKQCVPSLAKDISVEELLSSELLAQQPSQAFSDLSVSFLDKLSSALLADSDAKQYSDLVALAFWLRRANVEKLIADFTACLRSSSLLVPRGLTFHIAPANVDTIFCYSFALSLLAGNKNIVRLSEAESPARDILLSRIAEVVVLEEFTAIALTNRVVQYQRDDSINKYISAEADIRVIWGGDQTCSYFKSLPTKIATKDICFVDKRSAAAIDATGFLALNKQEQGKLSVGFYNDAFYFGQMACSSPTALYFVGDEAECSRASSAFWASLDAVIKEKGAIIHASTAVKKLTSLYQAAAQFPQSETLRSASSSSPAVILVPRIDELPEGAGGFFLERRIPRLADICDEVTAKHQTLTHFGFSESELRELVLSLCGRGIDRCVPVGQALDFSPDWDGFSLFAELTKTVSVLT